LILSLCCATRQNMYSSTVSRRLPQPAHLKAFHNYLFKTATFYLVKQTPHQSILKTFLIEYLRHAFNFCLIVSIILPTDYK